MFNQTQIGDHDSKRHIEMRVVDRCKDMSVVHEPVQGITEKEKISDLRCKIEINDKAPNLPGILATGTYRFGNGRHMNTLVLRGLTHNKVHYLALQWREVRKLVVLCWCITLCRIRRDPSPTFDLSPRTSSIGVRRLKRDDKLL